MQNLNQVILESLINSLNIILFSIVSLLVLSILSAYIIEYSLGHKPCNLCLIERIPYISAIILVSLIFIIKKFELYKNFGNIKLPDRLTFKSNKNIIKSNISRKKFETQVQKAKSYIKKEIIGEVIGLEKIDTSEACEFVASITGDNSRQVVSFGTEAGLFQEVGISTVVCLSLIHISEPTRPY
mgnify:CR=1 FL=1